MMIKKLIKDKDVLHINSYFSTRYLYNNLYLELKNKKIEQKVYVPVPFNFTFKYAYEDFTIISRCYSVIDRLLFFPKHRKIYFDLLNKIHVEDIKLSHAYSLFSNGYIAYKLWKEYKIPYIVTVRNTDINFFFKYLKILKNLGNKILTNSQKIIFLSPAVKNQMITQYISEKNKSKIEEKSLIIPNGIDNYWLENRIKKTKKNNKLYKILVVAEISKNKNILRSVSAINKLKREGISVEINIVGRNKNKKLLKKIISKGANYYGNKNQGELKEVYRQNDIFLLASHKESFGLVYAEALSQGLPIIYTRNQGFDLQFKEGLVGLSVNSKSIMDIKNKVKIIIENYNEFQNNIYGVIDKFNWIKIAQEYEKIYREIKEV